MSKHQRMRKLGEINTQKISNGGGFRSLIITKDTDFLAKSIALTISSVNQWELDMEAFSLSQTSAHHFTPVVVIEDLRFWCQTDLHLNHDLATY